MIWETVRLEEVATITAGGKSGLSGKHFVENGLPAYGAGGLNGYLPSWEHEDGAVILSSIGARCGKCFFPEGKWSSLANTQLIFPDPERVDRRFLWWQLNGEARWLRSGSAQPYIKPSNVKSHSVAIPPLPEQRRIASILDRVQEMRAQRDETIRQLDSLPGHIYSQRFGARVDPISPLEDLLAHGKNSIRTGPFGSQMLVEEFVDSGVAILGIDNVRSNSFESGANRHITLDKYNELARYKVYPEDVLITIMGTVGRICVVPAAIPLAITSKHLCALTLNRDRILPGYLQAYILYHPTARKHLRESQKGAIMAGLNMSIIRGLPVVVPPMREQQRFIAVTADVSVTRGAALTHRAALSELARSLQHRAFKGEL